MTGGQITTLIDRACCRVLRFKQQLAMLKDEHPGVIEEVRGEGLLLGLKLRVPNTEFAAALRERHLLAVGAGDNVVRILPPLTVSDAELSEGIAAIGAAAASFEAKKDAAA